MVGINYVEGKRNQGSVSNSNSCCIIIIFIHDFAQNYQILPLEVAGSATAIVIVFPCIMPWMVCVHLSYRTQYACTGKNASHKIRRCYQPHPYCVLRNISLRHTHQSHYALNYRSNYPPVEYMHGWRKHKADLMLINLTGAVHYTYPTHLTLCLDVIA